MTTVIKDVAVTSIKAHFEIGRERPTDRKP